MNETTTTTDRSLRGCADALDALARVIGPTYSTIRGVQATVAGDEVKFTTDLKTARTLARALGFDPDASVPLSAGLVHQWRGPVADLDVTVYGKRTDQRAERAWEQGAREARAALAAIPVQQDVPARLVADVLGQPGTPAHIAAAIAMTSDVEMRGTYRAVRLICEEADAENPTSPKAASGQARAMVRSHLQVLDEAGFCGPEDVEAADAAFLATFGVSR